MPPRRNAGLYVSSASVTDALFAELVQVFDTAQDFPEFPPWSGFIHPVPDSEWALGEQPAEIYARHRQTRFPEYLAKPVVVLDEQTARDKSVLVLSPLLTDDGVFVLHGVRFDARKVPGAAVNLSIGNQGLDDYYDIQFKGFETVDGEGSRI
ncbi:hypothetical protein DFH11DRAFT_1731218 [Phellopilus nigrolimitatus]|nr:hypothetical protein DFH11DRAFT_1731218 [Phellopilus nigrolimitatus]